MKPIISVENLGKMYRLGARRRAAYETLRDRLAGAARAPLRLLRRGEASTRETLWALRGVDFEVAQGEVVGVVGRNGAGKSTLLKVLSRITEPTEGRVRLYGRVGSLLEVGTGFHPELTGRENIFLNGAILGMKRTEIARQFDEIVAFSEIEKFIDTPVKFYSSGMYMRLAFAVAAHLEPEILIVDEVLAVGDASFQKKCLGKMGSVAREGRTVLFVSHNMTAVQSLCDRVIWLREGQVAEDGRADRVVSDYLKTSLSALAERSWEEIESAPGNRLIKLRRACVRPEGGAPAGPVNVHTPLVVEFEYWNLVPGARLNVSVVVSNEEGLPIFNTGSGYEPVWHGKPFPEGLFRSAFRIPGDLLNDGTHRVQFIIVKDQTQVIYNHEDLLVFEVSDTPEGRGNWYGKWLGAVRPKLEWETQLVETDLRAPSPGAARVSGGR
jgi:lipopolysaccharide transport system ATP-binding protein